jgi:hypothetical protein
MTLIQWSSTPETQQREIALQWNKEGSWKSYEQLAQDAAQLLFEDLRHNPAVSAVQLGGGEMFSNDPNNPLVEIVLNVCTVSPVPEKVKDCPARFKGFRVVHLDLGQKKKEFHKTWIVLFKELNGWSEEQTLIWAEKWNDSIEGRRPSDILHAGPVDVALSDLVDEDTRTRAGTKLQKLYNEIRSIIRRPTEGHGAQAYHHPDVVEDYNWHEVRRQIDAVTAEFKKANTREEN